MKGTIEYTRKDGKIDGGRIVKAVEVESSTVPILYEYREEVDILFDSMETDVLKDRKKYVIVIAEVD